MLTEVFRILHAREKLHLAGLWCVMTVNALLEVAGVSSILPFMGLMANPNLLESNQIVAWLFEHSGQTQRRDFLILLGASTIILLVIANLVAAANNWLVQSFSGKLTCRLQATLLRRYLSLPFAYYLDRNSASLVQNIHSECSLFADGFINNLLAICSRGVVALGIIAVLFWVDPYLALTSAATLVSAYILVYRLIHHSVAIAGQDRQRFDHCKLKVLGETFGVIKELKLYATYADFLSRFDDAAARGAGANVKGRVLVTLPRYVIESLAFVGMLAIALYLLAADGNVATAAPTLSLYVLAGYRLMPALQQVFTAASTARMYFPTMRAISDELQGHVVIVMPDRVGRRGSHKLKFQHELCVERITFQYSGSVRNVLSNVSFKVPANSFTAIVGGTGSGKTTLVDIILGLLRPTCGRLLVDLESLDESNVSGWQALVGYVPQQIHLMDDSIRRNIALGCAGVEIDDEMVRKAAALARIHDFVTNELPEGYETVIGERGVRLSGGQRQRIGIARALYRDPKILLLDEATSALDGETEEAVMEAIHSLAHQKTLIVIAHRLTTVREADNIVLLKEGQLVAEGTYSYLVATSEYFRGLAQIREVT